MIHSFASKKKKRRRKQNEREEKQGEGQGRNFISQGKENIKFTIRAEK
jgi:hypothetical protein